MSVTVQAGLFGQGKVVQKENFGGKNTRGERGGSKTKIYGMEKEKGVLGIRKGKK